MSDMESDLKRGMVAWCRRQGIPLVGVADATRWHTPPFVPWMPEDFFPQSIFLGTESVVVIGLPVHLPVIETTPSIFYHEHYNTLNRLLDQFTYQIAERFNQAGYPSVSLPRDGYGSIEVLRESPVAFFSHRHAAFLAGLGTFGLNNMVLTQGYGPRVRFSSVFTTARLPPDPLMKIDLCTRCHRCVEMCPARALPEDPYPLGITRKEACTEYSAALFRRHASPCGVCIKVCPVGEDRQHFDRTDPGIYSRQYPDPALARAWAHVRRYGLKGAGKEV